MDMDKQLTGLWTIMSYIIRKLLFSNRIYITLLVTMLVGLVLAADELMGSLPRLGRRLWSRR